VIVLTGFVLSALVCPTVTVWKRAKLLIGSMYVQTVIWTPTYEENIWNTFVICGIQSTFLVEFANAQNKKSN
jgi:hypothetical protein